VIQDDDQSGNATQRFQRNILRLGRLLFRRPENISDSLGLSEILVKVSWHGHAAGALGVCQLNDGFASWRCRRHHARAPIWMMIYIN
jgi:hypothetical protein